MEINFNRRKIESIYILLCFVLIVLLVIFAILAIADEIFAWDLLSDNLERIARLFLSSIGITIGATFLMSLMINFSLISISIEKIEGDDKPTTLADFFDTEKFPGKRGLRKSPKANLEMALIADGVAPDEVYATLETDEGVESPG